MPLQYKIDILKALKDKGYNTGLMRRNKILSESAIQNLRNREPISWGNIDKICSLLQCQPSDILVFSPETEEAGAPEENVSEEKGSYKSGILQEMSDSLSELDRQVAILKARIDDLGKIED